MPTWQDITYPISEGMPAWPGQPPVEINNLACIETMGDAAISGLSFSAHTGTHLDAPNHFIEGDDDVTAFPLDLAEGTLRVARVTGDGHATADDLAAYEARTRPLGAGERIAFRTRNSDRDWTKEPFDEDYAAVAPSLAKALIERKADLAAVDYLSVAPFDDPATTHRLLLHARVWVIEGLDLRHVDEGEYAYLALPLKLVGSDASPIRVLIRPA